MNCRKAQSLLSAFSNEELSHSVREKLLEHLEACPGCQKKSVVARQVGEAIRHLPRRELSDDFNMRLFERIHNAPREAGFETAHMPKAAPSALFYRLKLAAPIASIAAMLILVLTLVTGTAEINPADGPQVAADVTSPSGMDQVQQAAYRYGNSGLRGLQLEQAVLESLTVAMYAGNDSLFRQLASQQRLGFGTLKPGPIVRNAGRQAGNTRHYVLPNVPSDRRLVKDAAY